MKNEKMSRREIIERVRLERKVREFPVFENEVKDELGYFMYHEIIVDKLRIHLTGLNIKEMREEVELAIRHYLASAEGKAS